MRRNTIRTSAMARATAYAILTTGCTAPDPYSATPPTDAAKALEQLPGDEKKPSS